MAVPFEHPASLFCPHGVSKALTCGTCRAADPAQSAPSAEQLANAEHDRLFPPRGQDESANDFLTRALTEHSNSHMDWVTYYEKHPETQRTLDDGHTLEYQKRCVWRYSEIFSAFKELNEAAALRTAQLERERDEALELNRTEREATLKHQNFILEITHIWKTRAETAESALRDAKTVVERVLMVLPTAIYGCAGCGGSGVRSISEHHLSCHGDCEQCPVEGQVQCECEGKNVDVAGLLDEMRALLTVAAQTPEEK